MEKYICKMCGHVYDPEEGDSIGGIEHRTKFEDLPDKWACPECGATKSLFKKEE